MNEKSDLRRGESSISGGIGTSSKFDSSNDWDATVIAEAELLRRWTGVENVRLAHSNDGTRAADDGTIYVDRKQLDALFGLFAGEKYKTAVFFALAHEFGHLCQFKIFGINETFKKPRIEVEAHADYLSGAWLGLRLAQGQERLSEDLLAAGMQLKSGCLDYPSAYQRGRLVQDAQGLTVLLVHIVEPQILDGDYSKLEAALNRRDIEDLYGIARRRLFEIPREENFS